MIKYTLFHLIFIFVLTALISPSASFAQDRNSSERFFGYLDRNKDGKLDSDEVRRMPSSVREAFAKADYSLDRGISKDDFIREMPRIMEQMRNRRDEERENRGSDSNRSESRREEPSKSSKGATYTPKKWSKITVDIPSKFEDGDIDKDGQIGLYEWRKWRPEEKYHFPVYDLNQDGFLTPRELSNPPSKEEIDNYLASIGATTQPVVNSKPSDPDNVVPPTKSQSQTVQTDVQTAKRATNDVKKPMKTTEKPEEEDQITKTARLFFQQMDADKNGSLTPDEWARSRRLKPKFEEVGIDLDGTMNVEQFTTAYRQIYGEP